ncbi:hypothetical protein BKA70DRAFT_1451277 [Coprinopsis sp. MPI-PUGE-AT-0042]|nr:hypothetical protein BKA70DRAFT_1451277 [Coprinopsis sp. MPI-PUGE-AT-0042]
MGVPFVIVPVLSFRTVVGPSHSLLRSMHIPSSIPALYNINTITNESGQHDADEEEKEQEIDSALSRDEALEVEIGILANRSTAIGASRDISAMPKPPRLQEEPNLRIYTRAPATSRMADDDFPPRRPQDQQQQPEIERGPSIGTEGHNSLLEQIYALKAQIDGFEGDRGEWEGMARPTEKDGSENGGSGVSKAQITSKSQSTTNCAVNAFEWAKHGVEQPHLELVASATGETWAGVVARFESDQPSTCTFPQCSSSFNANQTFPSRARSIGGRSEEVLSALLESPLGRERQADLPFRERKLGLRCSRKKTFACLRKVQTRNKRIAASKSDEETGTSQRLDGLGATSKDLVQKMGRSEQEGQRFRDSRSDKQALALRQEPRRENDQKRLGRLV